MVIEKIEYHPYTLTPRKRLNRLAEGSARSGVLLKVSFNDLKLPGHADLFSWPELGDETLDSLIESIKRRRFLPQVESAIAWARREAEFASNNQSMISNVIIKNHITCSDIPSSSILAPTAKIKISREIVENWTSVENMLRLSSNTVWRLDFNSLFRSKEEAHHFWQLVSADIKERIEFLEDPFIDDLMLSEEAIGIFKDTQIAADRAPSALCDIRVIKPVYFSPEALISEATDFKKKIVITSNMDHPIGQLTALAGAQIISSHVQLLSCGLLTHDLYEPSIFSNWVKDRDNVLYPSQVTSGWGIRDSLEKLDWQRL